MLLYISVVAPLTAALHAGHMKAASTVQQMGYNSATYLTVNTTDLVQLLQITAARKTVCKLSYETVFCQLCSSQNFAH